MNIIIETLLPYVIPSLIGFFISLFVTQYYGRDYTAFITAIVVLLIGGTPLVISLFFNNDFTIPFYLWEMSWAPGFLAGNIVDLVFYPLFSELFEK